MRSGHALQTLWLAPPLPERSFSHEWEHVGSLARAEPVQMTGLSKCEAEDLLDWLEANGIASSQVQYDPGRGFTVAYAR